jgi:hypothetical protein
MRPPAYPLEQPPPDPARVQERVALQREAIQPLLDELALDLGQSLTEQEKGIRRVTSALSRRVTSQLRGQRDALVPLLDAVAASVGARIAEQQVALATLLDAPTGPPQPYMTCDPTPVPGALGGIATGFACRAEQGHGYSTEPVYCPAPHPMSCHQLPPTSDLAVNNPPPPGGFEFSGSDVGAAPTAAAPPVPTGNGFTGGGADFDAPTYPLPSKDQSGPLPTPPAPAPNQCYQLVPCGAPVPSPAPPSPPAPAPYYQPAPFAPAPTWPPAFGQPGVYPGGPGQPSGVQESPPAGTGACMPCRTCDDVAALPAQVTYLVPWSPLPPEQAGLSSECGSRLVAEASARVLPAGPIAAALASPGWHDALLPVTDPGVFAQPPFRAGVSALGPPAGDGGVSTFLDSE